MASQFKSLANYADFKAAPPATPKAPEVTPKQKDEAKPPAPPPPPASDFKGLGLVYRLEIHLPETQNVETFRAIFRALREELMP